MTSEVLVMNRLAVALAADSAVTVSDGRRDKVYNSANKLFMLSRRNPIGIMIYNNSSFLGVPWEAIVKLFRKSLGDREFDTVSEYADELVRFLQASLWMFPKEAQREHVLDLVAELFADIEDRIKATEDARLGAFARRTMSQPDQVKERTRIADEVVQGLRDAWMAKRNSAVIPASVAEEVYTQDSGVVHDRLMDSFKIYAIGQETTQWLADLVKAVIYKAEVAPYLRSGIVIAGFGAKEVFPSFKHLHFGGIYRDQLKYALVSGVAISARQKGHVETFADSGMANVFLNGITPAFEREMITSTFHILKRLTDEFVDAMPRVSAKRRKAMKSNLLPLQRAAAQDWYQLARQAQKESHQQLVHEGITSAPVDQLAHIAASLVNLNSFRKKMSLSPETVGGPVDVAVITKGDGFVWIERKHYFRPELNDHYFRNAGHVIREKKAGGSGESSNGGEKRHESEDD